MLFVQAHCQVYVIETFMEKVSQAIDDNVKLVLGHLFQLYAFNGIANDAVDFIEVFDNANIYFINLYLLRHTSTILCAFRKIYAFCAFLKFPTPAPIMPTSLPRCSR